jgi:hypothetical protein
MNVVLTPPVEIAMRTLGPEDQQEIRAWFENLKNWEQDADLRTQAQQLNPSDKIYILKTSSDFCIFFRLERDRIVLLDLATKETIRGFASVSGPGATILGSGQVTGPDRR